MNAGVIHAPTPTWNRVLWVSFSIKHRDEIIFRNLANVFRSFAGNPLEERTLHSLLKWQIKENFLQIAEDNFLPNPTYLHNIERYWTTGDKSDPLAATINFITIRGRGRCAIDCATSCLLAWFSPVPTSYWIYFMIYDVKRFTSWDVDLPQSFQWQMGAFTVARREGEGKTRLNLASYKHESVVAHGTQIIFYSIKIQILNFP